MPPDPRQTTINFQLEKELRDALQAAAAASERSASAEIRVALRAHLAGLEQRRAKTGTPTI